MKTKLITKAGRNALVASAMLALGCGSVLAEDSTTYKFGGYVKFDAMFSDYSGDTPDSNNLCRQFYVVGCVPTSDSSRDMSTDFMARESRINFRSDTVLDNGDKLGTYIEMDFLTHGDGNERVSNSYSPRLRHAFLKYNGWLFGQTWSTFMDVSVLPENLDFVGPAESTTFIRQGQVRYTTGAWEFAAENPHTDYLTYDNGATGTASVSDVDTVPDLVVRYTFKLDGGSYIKVAGLYRSLNVDTDAASSSETGLGISASAKFMFGQDDLRAMVTWGSGVGRYLALNASRAAVLDSSGSLKAIDQVAAFISYRHLWNDKWRSNLTFGTLSIDNDTALTGTSVTETATSVHVNLLYQAAPKLTIGAEYFVANRDLESGADGDLNRLMFSAKYAF